MRFDFLINTYGMLQNFCSSLWNALTMPLSDFVAYLLTLFPGSSGVIIVWDKILELTGTEFLYQMTFLDVLFGTGLALVIIFNVIKFILGVLPIV